MAIVFYDHLIDWSKLEQKLDELALDKELRLEYTEHIEHSLHTEILMVIIGHLPPHKHEEFLDRFHAAPHDIQHLHFLVTHGRGDVETAIQTRANEVLNEILDLLV